MSRDPIRQPRRFWKSAGVLLQPEGHAVALDGRVPRTPAGRPLILPTPALAGAVAAEWEAQATHLDPLSMPLTRLANVAIDRTPLVREDMATEFSRFADTDLTCFYHETPPELTLCQHAAWDEVRDWAGRVHGIALKATVGLTAPVQPAASLAAARAFALSLDDFRLTGLLFLTPVLGSALLALAVEQGLRSASEAFAASRIEEDWQARGWGIDEEAAALAALRLRDAQSAGVWFDTLK